MPVLAFKRKRDEIADAADALEADIKKAQKELADLQARREENQDNAAALKVFTDLLEPGLDDNTLVVIERSAVGLMRSLIADGELTDLLVHEQDVKYGWQLFHPHMLSPVWAHRDSPRLYNRAGLVVKTEAGQEVNLKFGPGFKVHAHAGAWTYGPRCIETNKSNPDTPLFVTEVAVVSTKQAWARVQELQSNFSDQLH